LGIPGGKFSTGSQNISWKYGSAFLPATVKGSLFGEKMKIRFKAFTAALVLSVSFNSTVFSSVSFAFSNEPFPRGPRPEVTPGELCTTPDARRYPEHIAYCDRDVHSDVKKAIIAMYDRQFGYQIGRMDRGAFKIDHYIPLCAGGSNTVKNLWPQHVSIYNITDPLEPAICNKMAEGRLSQKDAVAIVIQAKNNLDQVPAIIRRLNQL
jgi:hypothetical protein